MNSRQDNDWTASEAELLASLQQDQPNLPGHEDQTVLALRQRRLVQTRIQFSWLRPLQLAGAVAAIGLAFLAGTQYQKQRDPGAERALVPVAAEQLASPALSTASAAAGYDLAVSYDLLDESFSPANSHPKDRMSRTHRRDQ